MRSDNPCFFQSQRFYNRHNHYCNHLLSYNLRIILPKLYASLSNASHITVLLAMHRCPMDYKQLSYGLRIVILWVMKSYPMDYAPLSYGL